MSSVANNAIPLSYTVPPFPSLYWPFHAEPGQPKYLYTLTDIWTFTLYWTLITIPLAHFLVALWAILMQLVSAHGRRKYLTRTLSAKNRKLLGNSPYQDSWQWAGVILAVYLILGGLEAFLAGSLVGLVLGAVYNAGYFRMSVWTPLAWGIINMLVLILSSFKMSGGL